MTEQQPVPTFSMSHQKLATVFGLAARAPLLDAERLWLDDEIARWQKAVEAQQAAQAQGPGPTTEG